MRRSSNIALGLGGLLLGLTIGGQGCAEEEPGTCESGCDEGLECRAGGDGELGCFCSTEHQTGCGEGLDCYDREAEDPECLCSVDRQTGCEAGLACESVPGHGADCFEPVTLRGSVFDLATGTPIEGARVVARDANNAALSGVVITDVAGNYSLPVPTPRNPDGSLLPNPVTLRVDAMGYLSFPRPPRVAVPVDTAMASGSPLVVDTPATDVALIAFPESTGLGSIAGVVAGERPRGTLVVAGASSGIADFDGSYAVFNVAAGSVGVNGYKVGDQLESVTADVSAGQLTEGVDIGRIGDATAYVAGKVEIVNPGNGSDTSVILVVEDTFEPTFASGDSPPGLRMGGITGAFRFDGVPDGNYVALAAFENDFLVRDPDTAIGGTDIVHLTVTGGDLDLSQSFKVTGSLEVMSPDAEEVVSGIPTFVWEDDSGEDHYEVVVYDAFGNLVWEKLDVPGVSGDKNVEVPYEGPPLETGLLYQFRATSIKQGGSPISRTEDLRGVFVYGAG
jgi:hypothetical protein